MSGRSVLRHHGIAHGLLIGASLFFKAGERNTATETPFTSKKHADTPIAHSRPLHPVDSQTMYGIPRWLAQTQSAAPRTLTAKQY
jgi:hypothetical protein